MNLGWHVFHCVPMDVTHEENGNGKDSSAACALASSKSRSKSPGRFAQPIYLPIFLSLSLILLACLSVLPSVYVQLPWILGLRAHPFIYLSTVVQTSNCPSSYLNCLSLFQLSSSLPFNLSTSPACSYPHSFVYLSIPRCTAWLRFYVCPETCLFIRLSVVYPLMFMYIYLSLPIYLSACLPANSLKV